MDKRNAIEYFGTGADLARALTAAGYPTTRGAITNWRGELVPELSARRLHEITRGRLRFDPRVYRVPFGEARRSA